ncbi:MAG: glycosyltransferase family 2 protein [Phycisphaerae bacterium]|nr:glycosyltransferase family 2 protein [Phycisphaerae bacterium]
MRTLLAIPIFNEEKHLRAVLARVREYVHEILVVDDGSTDGTAALIEAERGIFKVRHPQNRGYGQSLIDAFTFAQDARYDWLITMDCDEQHEPAHIPEFIAAAGEDDADLISGSRYLAQWEGNGRPPPDRRRINRRVTNLLNSVLGLKITDAFCGFNAYRVDALRRLRLTVPGYAMPVQFWVQAARAGFRIRELPVQLIYNDPNRHFGGLLDDPDARLQHYLDVFCAELAREPVVATSGISTVNPVCSG